MFDYDRLHDEISILRKKQIFFIGGPIKSGTTWLQLLLNAHPDVSCNGEGHFMNVLASYLKSAFDAHGDLIIKKNNTIFNEIGGYPQATDDNILYALASCISMFLIEQAKTKPAKVIGEKSPDNVRHFAELSTLFPTAKFIQIVRDGRDCAVSAWFHNLRVSNDWAMANYGSLEKFAISYAEFWKRDLAAAQMFADEYPDRVCQVRYENLVASTHVVLKGIFAFLGVDVSDAILTNCSAEASFSKLSGGRSPGTEDRCSFFRKGISEDWRNHLTAVATARFVDQAGMWLKRFNYT